MNTITIDYGKFRVQDWLLAADISSGAKMTYTVLALCARGQDHAWPTQSFLAEKTGVCVRTIQRYLGELAAQGFIEIGLERIKGKLRKVYWFLRHQVMPMEENQEQNFPPESGSVSAGHTTNCRVMGDNLSPRLTIKKENIKTPPFARIPAAASSPGLSRTGKPWR